MQKQLINRVLIVDEAVSTQNIPFYFRERIIRNSDSLFAVKIYKIIQLNSGKFYTFMVIYNSIYRNEIKNYIKLVIKR